MGLRDTVEIRYRSDVSVSVGGVCKLNRLNTVCLRSRDEDTYTCVQCIVGSETCRKERVQDIRLHEYDKVSRRQTCVS